MMRRILLAVVGMLAAGAAHAASPTYPSITITNGGTLSGTFTGSPTLSGAWTFGASGTGLAVTHDATVGGALSTTTGALTVGSSAATPFIITPGTGTTAANISNTGSYGITIAPSGSPVGGTWNLLVSGAQLATGAIGSNTGFQIGNGGQTVTNSTVPYFQFNVSNTGTWTNGTPYNYASLVTTDGVAAGTPGSSVLFVQDSINSTAATGPRNGISAAINISAAASGLGDSIAGSFATFANNQSGGAAFGVLAKAIAQASAAGTTGIVGEEIDVGAVSGSSPAGKIGLQIVQVLTDAVAGTTNDIGLSINNQATAGSGTKGWKHGIEFGSANGYWPIVSTGTLIDAAVASGSMAAANGIDWSGVMFSGYALKLPGFTVDGSGNVGIGGTLNVASTLNIGTAVGAGSNVNIETPNGSNIVFNPQGSGNVQVLSPLSAVGEISTAFDPVSGSSVGLLFQSSANLSGTVTAGERLNQFVVNSDLLNASGLAQPLADIELDHNIGGTGFSGGRTGILINLTQTGAVAGTPGVFANVINGLQSSVTLNNSFGGTGATPSTAAGYATALNPYLSFNSGFTNGGGGSGEEIDVGTASGASFMDAIGLLVARLSNGSQAARADAAIVIAGATPSAGHGWKTGLSFSYGNGDTGIDPGGTLIGTDAAAGLTAAYGINFSTWTFTGAALKLPGFTVDGTGNITITSPATGAPTKYACFTSSGQLIASATAC